MRLVPMLLLLVPLAAPAAGKGEVYKWVDDKGVVHYTDKPPREGAKPASLPKLQTYRGGTAPPIEQFQGRPEPGRASGAPRDVQLELVTPSNEETFHSAERTVPVAVLATPGLDARHRLVYLLDGVPRSEPTTDTSFAITGIDRGSHQVSVMLTDENGAELARTNAVTVHVSPPIVPRTKTVPKPPGGSPSK